MAWDWTQYSTGGAQRPDSFSGMQSGFSGALEQMFASAPPEVQAELRVSSGYRSPERQAQLWAEALQKYGSPEAARKWVAPPGKSQHGNGNAADLKYASDAARQWAHDNAAQYGLAFPLGNEPWHIELASARGGPQGASPQGQAPQGGNALAMAPQGAPQGQQNALAQQPAPQRQDNTTDPTPFLQPANQLAQLRSFRGYYG